MRICASLRIRFDSWFVPFHLRQLGVKVGTQTWFVGAPVVSLTPGSSIELGDEGMFLSKSYATALGVCHPVILRTMSPVAHIQIGNYVGVSGSSICAAKSVRIGDGCLLGADVIISDSDFHAVDPEARRDPARAFESAAPVRIGNNVFLGARAIVLKGVSIGDNTVVGAGSVVTRDLPKNVIAAGNPCRVIRAMGGKGNL